MRRAENRVGGAFYLQTVLSGVNYRNDLLHGFVDDSAGKAALDLLGASSMTGGHKTNSGRGTSTALS